MVRGLETTNWYYLRKCLYKHDQGYVAKKDRRDFNVANSCKTGPVRPICRATPNRLPNCLPRWPIQSAFSFLCNLVGGEMAVGSLATTVDLSQSALSQHLAKLRALKLVKTRRDAQTIYYSLASGEVQAILETLYGLYCDPGLQGITRRDAGKTENHHRRRRYHRRLDCLSSWPLSGIGNGDRWRRRGPGCNGQIFCLDQCLERCFSAPYARLRYHSLQEYRQLASRSFKGGELPLKMSGALIWKPQQADTEKRTREQAAAGFDVSGPGRTGRYLSRRTEI